MPFKFEIWYQGENKVTPFDKNLGLRITDPKEVARFAEECNQPDVAGKYDDLQDFLNKAPEISKDYTPPYHRVVDVISLSTKLYKDKKTLFGRTLIATMVHDPTVSKQGTVHVYVIIQDPDPGALDPEDLDGDEYVMGEYTASPGRDVLVILSE